MLFCDDCADKNHWPKMAVRYVAGCEVCDEIAECSELPSSDLAIATLPTDEEGIAELRAELEALKLRINEATGIARAAQGFER